MLYSKPPTTIDQQIDALIARGMSCPDRDKATRYLSTIGYYRLSAYWLPLEEAPAKSETRSKRFRPGVTLQNATDLYVFDRHLRLLVMEAIERIEIHVRSRWVYHLSLAHGPHAHMNPELFSNPWEHTVRIAKLASSVKDSEETFIGHYVSKYKTPYLPPLWAVVETMTISELSKWVSSTKDYSVRDRVAKDLGMPTRELFEGVFQVLCLVRNICAHHGRLWNRKLVKRIPIIKRLGNDIETEPHPNHLKKILRRR